MTVDPADLSAVLISHVSAPAMRCSCCASGYFNLLVHAELQGSGEEGSRDQRVIGPRVRLKWLLHIAGL